MTPLMIAADYPIYPQRIGGMDRFFWALDETLRKTGRSPVWVFPESTSSHHYRERGMDLRFVSRPAFSEELTKLIAAEGGVQVLVTHFAAYNTRYPAKWKHAGALHVVAVDHMSRPMVPRPLGFRIRHLLKGIVTLKDVDRVIAVSSFIRDSIVRELGWWWSRKTRVVWNGVAVTTAGCDEVHENSQEEFCMCFIGYLMPEKGVDVVLRAAAGLVADGARIRMTIAGDGPELATLVDLSNRLGLQDRVDFIGTTIMQMKLMREHDLVVIPSLWKEACPLVVLEAMMSGACILASDIGGIPELLGAEAGLTASPGDVDAWRFAMLTLLHDSDARASFRLAARKRAIEHFTLTRMVQDHIREIESARAF